MKTILASISALVLTAGLAAAGGAGCDKTETSASTQSGDGVTVPVIPAERDV